MSKKMKNGKGKVISQQPSCQSGSSGGVHKPVEFMPKLEQVPKNCPPGLEYLIDLEEVAVRWRPGPLELATGFRGRRTYELIANGYMIYLAQQCDLMWGRGQQHPFEISVTNQSGAEVFRVKRPLLCCSPDEAVTSTAAGDVLGKVSEDFACCSSAFTLYNSNQLAVLRIVGPPCLPACCEPMVFNVSAMNDEVVGTITGYFTPMCEDLSGGAHVFDVAFQRDLSVQVKAALLGACFLIDFRYYQRIQH